jgi:hypothetical protein
MTTRASLFRLHPFLLYQFLVKVSQQVDTQAVDTNFIVKVLYVVITFVQALKQGVDLGCGGH